MVLSSQESLAGAPRIVSGVFRYALAAVGPVGTAVAHFILSLLVLKLAPPAAFGAFSFLFVIVQLTWGIWSALFCAPLPVVLAAGDAIERAEAVHTFVASSSLGAAASVIPFFVLAVYVGLDSTLAFVFALYGSLALVRWFGRAFNYANGEPIRTILSDLAYGV